MRRFLFTIFMLFAAAWVITPMTAHAHPDDEFCADDMEMDPELCRQLAALDRESTAEDAFATYGATEITPISLDRPVIETVWLYIKLGFIHILPRGYDHILFVLALFLATTRWRPLLLQVSAFTVAHTITLGLAAAGVVTVPANIVEPLIALSIAVIALENLFFQRMTRWRPLIIFGFGLFHGLGFAGVLSDLGLVRDQFLVSLVSFNVGVEFGQLTIIAFALALALAIRRYLPANTREQLYRRYVVWPGSLIIALFGLFWFFNRVFGG